MKAHESFEMAVLATVALFFAAGLAVMSYVGGVDSTHARETTLEANP